MINIVRELAHKHHIFIGVEPQCSGWELSYKYTIKEPLYSKFEYQGYYMGVELKSEESFDSYDEALFSGVQYVMANARRAHNGMLTLTKE